MKAKFRSHLAAAVLLAPAATLLSPSAQAQLQIQIKPVQAHVQPAQVVRAVSLDADHGLAPGSTLRLRVDATPRANWVNVTLGQSGIRVALRERAPGQYVGTHVVRRTDRIDPTQPMLVRLDYNGRVVAHSAGFPAAFQALAMGAPAVAPEIERFVMRPMGRIEAGRELRFRLAGAPGGNAWLDIPGVIAGVDLEETRPGVYEGSYVVRRRDNPGAFSSAVATLESGGRRVTARLDMRAGDSAWGPSRDEQPPVVVEFGPAHGARVNDARRTHVFARLSDDASGVDPSSVRLRINGDNVTDQARVSGDEVHFRDELEPGRYNVELTAKDRAGNLTRRTWTFDVVEEGRYGQWGGR
jgi:hypothetical protein